MLIKNIEIGVDTDSLKERIESDCEEYLSKIKKIPIVLVLMLLLAAIGCIAITIFMRGLENYSKSTNIIVAVCLCIIDVIFTVCILEGLCARDASNELFKRINYADFLDVVSYVNCDNFYTSSAEWIYNCSHIEKIAPRFAMGYYLVHKGKWACQLKLGKKNNVKVRCIEVNTKEEVVVEPDRYVVPDTFDESNMDNLVMCFRLNEIIVYDKTYLDRVDTAGEFRR